MTPKETLANLALGVGMIANPSLIHVDCKPMDVSVAIYSHFAIVGEYINHGVKVAQVEVQDAQRGEATQLKFDSILAS
jgi:hypothetical protein